jgi:hypothetical protein
MLPLPQDWSFEFPAPAKFYQNCFPQVLRYMNSVTNTDDELMATFWNATRRTRDKWETVHIQSSTGEWDYGKGIIKATGMDATIFAENLAQMNGRKDFPSTFGYFDEGSLSLRSESNDR